MAKSSTASLYVVVRKTLNAEAKYVPLPVGRSYGFGAFAHLPEPVSDRSSTGRP